MRYNFIPDGLLHCTKLYGIIIAGNRVSNNHRYPMRYMITRRRERERFSSISEQKIHGLLVLVIAAVVIYSFVKTLTDLS